MTMEWDFSRWPEVALFLVALVGGMAVSAWIAARDPFDDLIESLPLPENPLSERRDKMSKVPKV